MPPHNTIRSEPSDAPEHFTGKELWSACINNDATHPALCLGYAKSVSDELMMLSATSSTVLKGAVSIDCQPPSYNDDALLAVVRNYLLHYPKELPQSGPNLLQSALVDPLTCKPGKLQDKDIEVYATGSIIVSACRSDDHNQRSQCLGYLQGAYDHEFRILTAPGLKGLSASGVCKLRAQGLDRLKAAFFKAVRDHPDYLKYPATRVVTAVLFPPACPLAPQSPKLGKGRS
jgi:hypothetical protein